MKKSRETTEHRILVAVLREARKKAGLTQVELAELTGQTQSYVSKIERGDLRLDLVQMRSICQAIGISLPTLVRRFEKRLAE